MYSSQTVSTFPAILNTSPLFLSLGNLSLSMNSVPSASLFSLLANVKANELLFTDFTGVKISPITLSKESFES